MDVAVESAVFVALLKMSLLIWCKSFRAERHFGIIDLFQACKSNVHKSTCGQFLKVPYYMISNSSVYKNIYVC